MPILQHRVYWIILLLFAVLIPGGAVCDRIILRDGTIEVSDRVWESEKYIHFILKGTKAVEVRYSKEIVERIEKKDPKQTIALEPLKKKDVLEEKPAIASIAVPRHVPRFSTPMPPTKEGSLYPSKEASQIKIDSSVIDGIKNTSFYDPRRPKRYWAFRNSRHATLKGAVEALAVLYDRPTEWVEVNMGDENDLGIIHSRLMAAHDSEAVPEEKPKDDPKELTEPVFYNEARPFAYQTENKRFFRSRDEALKALSEKYGQPVDWIVDHMGESNVLSDIHGNLANAVSARPQKPVTFRKAAKWKPLDLSEDLHFYDPRRKRKYWISESYRFDTYQEATAALARQYGVPVKWIEANMGDTNRLKEIHENIRNRLSWNLSGK